MHGNKITKVPIILEEKLFDGGGEIYTKSYVRNAPPPNHYILMVDHQKTMICLPTNMWVPVGNATMNEVSAAIVAGGRAQFRIDVEVGRNKLITFLLNKFLLNPSTAAFVEPSDGLQPPC
jgi:hypothetical protein